MSTSAVPEKSEDVDQHDSERVIDDLAIMLMESRSDYLRQIAAYQQTVTEMQSRSVVNPHIHERPCTFKLMLRWLRNMYRR